MASTSFVSLKSFTCFFAIAEAIFNKRSIILLGEVQYPLNVAAQTFEAKYFSSCYTKMDPCKILIPSGVESTCFLLLTNL